MPNERHRHRAARRVDLLPRVRLAPVILIGLVAAAVLGRTPHGDAPVRWTMRDASSWMADYDHLREARLAALLQPGSAVVAAVETVPAAVRTGPIVVAEVDLAPRDVRKQVPRDAADPDIVGAVPKASQTAPRDLPEAQPTINRSGKGDRLLTPAPFGRTTDHDLFVKPTLAAVAPTQEGWPPLMQMASFIAPQSDKTLPHLALAAPDPQGSKDRVVVAMVRSGPGRVVTQSAIAALATSGRARDKSRPMLPPMPDAHMAAVNPRTNVWIQPPVPEIGYARHNDIEARFRAVLGDEEGGTRPSEARQSDDDLPP